MTELLIARNIHTRERYAVCDGRCFGALSDDCNCCCAGLNHGAGEEKARENCLTMIEHMTNYCKQTFGADTELVCKAKLFQPSLFK